MAEFVHGAGIEEQFQPTHRIKIEFPDDGIPYAGTYVEEIVLAEVATKRGDYRVGFTASDWFFGFAPRFAIDARGRVWLDGEPLPPSIPVMLQPL